MTLRTCAMNAIQWIFSMKASDGAFLLTAKDPLSSGAWPTSQAICAILASEDKLIDQIRDSLLWLQNRQKDGFWGPMQKGFQFNDSTVWTLLAFNLAHAITKEYEALLTESVSKLIKNINDDGGWGSWKYDQSRIVITSLIMILFNSLHTGKEANLVVAARNRAINFLLDCQNPDGGWGFRSSYDSNPVATSYVLIALSQQESAKAQIIDGVQWLEEEKRRIFNDNYELFKHESVWRADAIQRWSYFSLPLIAYALVFNGHSYSGYKVIRKLILEQRQNGSWIDPDEQYLNFHTYTTSYFLNQILKLLDVSHFERYLNTIEIINKEEYESILLANRSKLKRIILEDAFQYSDNGFALSSGKTSHFFYDLKPVILNPLTITIIGRIIWEMIKNESVNAVGGPETGAIPIAMSVVRESLGQGGELKAFYVRKKPKPHGTKRWIEGNLNRNDKVILLEDVVTTGSSVLNAIDKLLEHGCIVKKVISIIDREQGGAGKIKSKGVDFLSIFKHSDFKGAL